MMYVHIVLNMLLKHLRVVAYGCFIAASLLTGQVSVVRTVAIILLAGTGGALVGGGAKSSDLTMQEYADLMDAMDAVYVPPANRAAWDVLRAKLRGFTSL